MIQIEREKLEQALEALEFYVEEDDVIEGMEGNEYWVEGKRSAEKSIVAFQKALAQPERPWVGLTDKQIDSYFEDHGWSPSESYYPVIKDIEAKLKEKNT